MATKEPTDNLSNPQSNQQEKGCEDLIDRHAKLRMWSRFQTVLLLISFFVNLYLAAKIDLLG